MRKINVATQSMVEQKNDVSVRNAATVDFDRISITNDFMFGTVFQDAERCKELLQRILGIEIVELSVVEAQKSIKKTFAGKGRVSGWMSTQKAVMGMLMI